MAKIVSYTGFQAAAGTQDAGVDWEHWARHPGAWMVAAGALVGGAFVGQLVAESWKPGGRGLFDVDTRKGDPTDFEEWTSTVGLFAGLGVTWHIGKEMVDEYGIEKLGIGLAALSALVYGVKFARGDYA